MFGGYNTYVWAKRIRRRFGHLPRLLRLAVAGSITKISAETWNILFSDIARLLPARFRYANPGDKLHKLAEVIRIKDSKDIYRILVSHWKQPEQVVTGGHEPLTALTDVACWPEMPDFEHLMMYLDLISYLPDDILVKLDRAAMGVSLETRVPLLDHRVVEFAWRLPLAMKIRDGQSKWLLRKVLYRHVPKALIERPKRGFSVPINAWLRDWAEELLDESRLRRAGFFNPAPIRRRWLKHLSGAHNWQRSLWNVLMFQAWLNG